jgi:ABC-type Zn uptake system ZnuABC Zn-binding protein ZnuA
MKILLIFIFLSGCTTFSSTSNETTTHEPITVTTTEKVIYEDIGVEEVPNMGKILEGFMPSYLSF